TLLLLAADANLGGHLLVAFALGGNRGREALVARLVEHLADDFGLDGLVLAGDDLDLVLVELEGLLLVVDLDLDFARGGVELGDGSLVLASGQGDDADDQRQHGATERAEHETISSWCEPPDKRPTQPHAAGR